MYANILFSTLHYDKYSTVGPFYLCFTLKIFEKKIPGIFTKQNLSWSCTRHYAECTQKESVLGIPCYSLDTKIGYIQIPFNFIQGTCGSEDLSIMGLGAWVLESIL